MRRHALNNDRERTSPRTDVDSLSSHLIGVMQHQLASVLPPSDRKYLESRSQPAQVRRVVDAFLRYRRFLPNAGRLLDFGCGMGADSVLARTVIKPDVMIEGADIDSGKYDVVRRASGMKYTQLKPRGPLPYPDAHFSCVVASGVIEHVPMDNEILKELHRVLVADGTLIVTFLPNAASYTELAARTLHYGGHQRRYTRRGFREQLLHHGFSPITSGFHQLLPSGGQGGTGVRAKLTATLFRLNSPLERLWLIRAASANLFFVARAAHGMY